MVINRELPIPLYYQVEQTLRAEIEAGQISSGKPLPNEAQLMSQFGVSRITIQKALNNLAQAGLLERRRGKGTFVNSPATEEPYSCLRSFTAEVLSHGHQPSTQLLDFRIISAPPNVAQWLRLDDKAAVVFVKRLRLIDGEPVSIDSSYLPHRLVPKISKKIFAQSGPKQSLYYILER